jgi:uncharacterized protein (DUF433 family)
MDQEIWKNIITVEPGKCGGRPCIRGMRIRVVDVLGLLAAGMTTEEILDDFPDLTKEDIRACIEYSIVNLEHPVIRVA